MLALFAPLWRPLRALRVERPALVGAAGWVGVVAARHNALHAPVVIGVALGVAALAVALRERGAGLAAVGVAATAAFAVPPGLGPLLVVTGVAVACLPASCDRRLAPWSDVVDGLIALPAIAGLASVVASEPSQRGVVVGAATALLLVASWLRSPTVPDRRSVASLVGVVGGAVLAVAPQLWDWLGDLPTATVTAGRGVAAGFGVFAVVALIQAMRRPGKQAPTRGRHVRPSPRHVAR